ncbi:RidA family protein [Terrisporobacter sp.]|uniref:RidA family protein n=1 Tax=Terrisporobacter sp. TaxID=1965305 RepID=UPI00260DCD6B|nr:RidA family protein [Terrisporobacter sp.]
MKEIIETSSAPAAIGPYSQGVKVGNKIYTSGQLPINMSTGELEVEIKAATKASLDNCKAILESRGAKMSDVFKTVVFLSDMNNFSQMNEVYETYFTGEAPARSCVQVAKLPKEALVEIEVIAVVK